jgi:hypothetical protein
MKPGAVYRLRTPTIGAVRDFEDARPLPITLPAGAVLTVVDDDLGRTGYVRVQWDQLIITMFSIDLRERGELMDGAGAEAPAADSSARPRCGS